MHRFETWKSQKHYKTQVAQCWDSSLSQIRSESLLFCDCWNIENKSFWHLWHCMGGTHSVTQARHFCLKGKPWHAVSLIGSRQSSDVHRYAQGSLHSDWTKNWREILSLNPCQTFTQNCFLDASQLERQLACIKRECQINHVCMDSWYTYKHSQW